jgi:hypothetical protein
VQEEQETKGVTLGSDVYIVLRLDGRVRKSGVVLPSISSFFIVYFVVIQVADSIAAI